jgi:hypothetical protein
MGVVGLTRAAGKSVLRISQSGSGQASDGGSKKRAPPEHDE